MSKSDKSGPQSTDFTTDYKAKLDEAASQSKNAPPSDESSGGIVDKISQYVPVLGKALGTSSKEEESEASSSVEPSVPPRRPEHDPQIEEFIRDQHRSKKVVKPETDTSTD
ncbi:hypothetical protein N656DRAFT_776669 [Canariomyces notabilis]|uniref:Uncharacterized protein n=1 Tax=Canariomyces notabilis TaxID=2074819 RepID=A0AAN6YUH7_9PEZI|nr:hypothetical protein N656DRAFT_776669 [Canariomyces arenarius]